MSRTRYTSNDYNRRVYEISWPGGTGPPKNLVPFNEIKGKWTYPKPGFIQWKNEV